MSSTQATPATMSTPSCRRPELVAPAGDRDCLRAAVENGADAIYFGLDSGFNARARAVNFRLEELPEVMDFLRRRGLKGYVTLNTVVFSGELARLEETVRKVAEAGADAVMVQDLGLARLIRQVCPELPMHASTQMTFTSAECLAVVESLGFDRVVLPRELSIREIAKIHAQNAYRTGGLRPRGPLRGLLRAVPHQRVARRTLGQSRPVCPGLPHALRAGLRRPDVGPGPAKIPAQPAGPGGLRPVARALAAGVSALKIEGRLKTADYVANITRNYRTAIETALAGRPVEFAPRQVEEMEVSFSRGFSHGWLEGCDHKALVPGLSLDQAGRAGWARCGRGPRPGRRSSSCVRCAAATAWSSRATAAKKPRRADASTRSFSRAARWPEPSPSGLVELTFAHGAIDFQRALPGPKGYGRPTIPSSPGGFARRTPGPIRSVACRWTSRSRPAWAARCESPAGPPPGPPAGIVIRFSAGRSPQASAHRTAAPPATRPVGRHRLRACHSGGVHRGPADGPLERAGQAPSRDGRESGRQPGRAAPAHNRPPARCWPPCGRCRRPLPSGKVGCVQKASYGRVPH